jgi:hypothetical protein
MNLSLGSSTFMFLRLCSLAPFIMMSFNSIPLIL